MEEKLPPLWARQIKIKIQRYEKLIEVSTWAVIILIIFGIQLIPNRNVDDFQAYLLIGGIIAFALFYYLIAYRYFSRSKRLYIKDIADIVLIGSLILVLKDWGQYFFALFFLPIAAAALSLQLINALLIAAVASLFVIFEIFMNSQGLYPQSGELYQGAWQIGLILLITIFCRALALQLREEKSAKETSLAYQKVLEEEAKRQKEFLSLTSHQLYTPLSIIRGFTSLLHDKTLGNLNPRQEEAVKEIHYNSRRMADLVSELLSISRIQSGKIELKKENIQIPDLVQEVVNQFQKTVAKDKKVDVKFTCTQNLSPVSADKEKIRQVLYVIIDNAVKYTREGTIEVKCIEKKQNISVSIQDNGIGIEAQDFDKLFQPFFRGTNILELDNQGTGLGLYIARLLVEKHGGKIWAESQGKNKGATFSFTLPLIQS